MLNARDILSRVIRKSQPASVGETGGTPRHFTRFSEPEDTTPPPPKSTIQAPLSRFSHQHQRVKPQAKQQPKPAQQLSHEQAEAIIAQISNEGVETIPLSVLQRALPDRVATGGGVDALPQLMAIKPLRSRRHA